MSRLGVSFPVARTRPTPNRSIPVVRKPKDRKGENYRRHEVHIQRLILRRPRRGNEGSDQTVRGEEVPNRLAPPVNDSRAGRFREEAKGGASRAGAPSPLHLLHHLIFDPIGFRARPSVGGYEHLDPRNPRAATSAGSSRTSRAGRRFPFGEPWIRRRIKISRQCAGSESAAAASKSISCDRTMDCGASFQMNKPSKSVTPTISERVS